MVLARRRPAALILAVLLVLAALAAGLGAALSPAAVTRSAVTWTGQHATQDEAVTWSAPVRHAPGT